MESHHSKSDWLRRGWGLTASLPAPASPSNDNGSRCWSYGRGHPMMQSPPRQPARARQNQEPDDVSMASSDPRARPGQRRAPKDRRRGDARVIIERRRDDHRPTNMCDGPDVDKPAIEDSRCLPFEVGCPAFNHDLRHVRWPSARTFKPEIPRSMMEG